METNIPERRMANKQEEMTGSQLSASRSLSNLVFSLCAASGVQFPAEGARVSAGHQAVLSQHQVPSGQQQQQRLVSGARGETVFPHLHETAAGRLSPHQTLLQPPGETPVPHVYYLK